MIGEKGATLPKGWAEYLNDDPDAEYLILQGMAEMAMELEDRSRCLAVLRWIECRLIQMFRHGMTVPDWIEAALIRTREEITVIHLHSVSC